MRRELAGEVEGRKTCGGCERFLLTELVLECRAARWGPRAVGVSMRTSLLVVISDDEGETLGGGKCEGLRVGTASPFGEWVLDSGCG